MTLDNLHSHFQSSSSLYFDTLAMSHENMEGLSNFHPDQEQCLRLTALEEMV